MGLHLQRLQLDPTVRVLRNLVEKRGVLGLAFISMILVGGLGEAALNDRWPARPSISIVLTCRLMSRFQIAPNTGSCSNGVTKQWASLVPGPR